MGGERIVFVEETNPSKYLKLIAAGDMDMDQAEALEDFVKRLKKRLSVQGASGAASEEQPS